MRVMQFFVGVALVWAATCAWLWWRQESLIFHPTALPADHRFSFDLPFEEVFIPVGAGIDLSALFFPATATPAGAILYLHGNAGNLDGWGHHAPMYVTAGYDFFAVDYRGYGKSGGRISSEAQLHSDVEHAWDWLTGRHRPEDIMVVGYSLGTAPAARVACVNNAGGLVLLAPFFSGRDVARRTFPFFPSVLVRYPLRTDAILSECALPVTIFHGEHDRTISAEASKRLAALRGGRAALFLLADAAHDGVAEDRAFQRHMAALLATRRIRPTPEPGDRE